MKCAAGAVASGCARCARTRPCRDAGGDGGCCDGGGCDPCGYSGPLPHLPPPRSPPPPSPSPQAGACAPPCGSGLCPRRPGSAGCGDPPGAGGGDGGDGCAGVFLVQSSKAAPLRPEFGLRPLSAPERGLQSAPCPGGCRGKLFSWGRGPFYSSVHPGAEKRRSHLSEMVTHILIDCRDPTRESKNFQKLHLKANSD